MNPISFSRSLLFLAFAAFIVADNLSAQVVPGNLYASINGTAQNGGGFVNQYTSDAVQSTFLSGLDRPRGIIFDASGNTFLATTNLDGSGNYHGSIIEISSGGVQSVFGTADLNFFIEGLAMDSLGNIFAVADNQTDPNFAGTIYKFTAGGVRSTFGTVPGQSFGVAFDAAGNLYVADEKDQIIYKFNPSGTRTVFVGAGAFNPTEGPLGLAFDAAGNLFVSAIDSNNAGRILKFTPAAAGTVFATGLTNLPRGIAFDSAGNLFVAETGAGMPGDVLKFTPSGTETVFASGLGQPAGNGGAEYLAFPQTPPIPNDFYASINGTAQNNGGLINQYTPAGMQSTFLSGVDRPRGIVIDPSGNIFLATNTLDGSGNYHSSIAKFSSSGVGSTFGTADLNFFIEDLALDSSGNLYAVANNQNDPNLAGTIYKFTPGGTRSTFGTLPGEGFGLAFDSAGNLYAADNVDMIIYKFAPNGTRTVFVGAGAFNPTEGPLGLAFDAAGNLFVSSTDSNGAGRILKFTPAAAETVFATGLTNLPRGLAFDSAGNLFVAETGLSTPGDILKFTPGGTETVFASGLGRPTGNGGAEYIAFPQLVPTSGATCNGTYNGTFKGNITVSNGQDCSFVGGGVTGNVTVTGGNLALSNATVGNNVQINGGGSFSIGPSVKIKGNLQIQNIPAGPGQNQVCGSTVSGDLQFQNNGTAVQIGSSSPTCPGNTIGGNLTIQGNTAATVIFGNSIGGNLQDQNNTAATQVSNNTVGNNLQCQSNTTISGGGNTAHQKQGQCAGF